MPAQRDRPLRCARAPGAPRPDSDRRLRAPDLEQRLRPPLRLEPRRGLAFRQPLGGDVLAGLRSRLLPEPRRLHLPDLRPPAGHVRAARVHLRPALREHHPAVQQGPHRDLRGRPHPGRGAVHGGRGGHLLGREARVGRARGSGGRGGPVVRLPARGLLARGRDGRGLHDRRGAGPLLVRARPPRRAGCATTRWPAPPPGWPPPSSTRPAWRCCPWPSPRSPGSGPTVPGRWPAWPPVVRSPRWCSSCSTPTWPGPSTPGGPTFATRRRWPRTSPSRARTTAARATTWRASAGASGGPPPWPRWREPRSS